MQRDALLLGEMIDAAEQILVLAEGISEADLRGDRLRRDGLLWNFTVIGEAAAQVSEQTVGRHQEIPWRQPVLRRNRIVRGYRSIDVGLLLATASKQLPGLLVQLQAVRDAPSEPNDEIFD